MNYVNLYTQTEYSILSSNIAIDLLADNAKKKNYTTLGIADNDNMYGAIKFYRACKKENIKPIIGIRLSLASKNGYKNAILLYAKNNEGYYNLIKIASLKGTRKEAISLDDIKEYLQDLVLVIPNEENELVRSYIDSDFGYMQSVLKEYLSLKNNANLSIYLGLDLQTHDSKYKLGDLIYFASQNGIKSVALRKTNYFEDDDYEVYKILKSVSNNGKPYEGTEKEENSSLMNSLMVGDMFRKYPELVEATEEIANMCCVELDFDSYHMPKYELPSDTNANEYLKKLAYAGIKKRLVNDKVDKNKYHEYIARLDYELGVIKDMGFSDYFLIVYDFVKFAKKEGILIGPGRGSAVGSLVAYSIGITEVDSLKYNLYFERFLNPARVQMPDIDVDFPNDKRPIVLEYVGKRYGLDKVVHICTFNRYRPRKAIDDIARVIDLKKYYVDSIKKEIDDKDSKKSMREIIKEKPELARMAENNEIVKNVLEMMIKMENLPYSTSIHASGVIISDEDIMKYTPLLEGADGLYKTQYNDDDLESLGLLKMDFLNIDDLSIITNVLDRINISGQDVLKIYRLPLNIKDVYQMLSQGLTAGIPQLNTEYMTNILTRLKPTSFNDIVNVIALGRPGASNNIPSFINRKYGKEKITYPHEVLEPILKDTYGIIVYQEQILEIAKTFAGYSLSEADVLRKAVAKKEASLLANQKEKFITGAISKGYDKEKAEAIFKDILKFGEYGFNKSHSIGYAMFAYEMAYLKCRHFKEFMATIMSNSTEGMKTCLKELAQKQITVEVPDINKSTNEFIVLDNKIYYSLSAIKLVGENAAIAIIEEREQNGLYKDYNDFVIRTKSFLSQKIVEALIYSGALDSLGLTRKTMISEYEKSLSLGDYGELFRDELQTREYDQSEFNFKEISMHEKEALGINVKFDIFVQYGSLRREYKCTTINNIKPHQFYNVLFMIEKVKKRTTKKDGKEMAFIDIYDNTGSIKDVTIFPKTYQECSSFLVENKMLVAKMRCENEEGNLKLFLDKVFIDVK